MLIQREMDVTQTAGPQPGEILSFWFSEETKPHWFAASEAFDAKLKERFAASYDNARSGELNAWAENAEGALALILLLDQIPRNIRRNTPEAFATDARALSEARKAIARGFDRQLSSVQRQFLYLPFMHSEELQDQEQGMELYAALDLAEPLDFMRRHRDIIARFGRFPHRNKILGRQTTQEEAAFLEGPGSHF